MKSITELINEQMQLLLQDAQRKTKAIEMYDKDIANRRNFIADMLVLRNKHEPTIITYHIDYHKISFLFDHRVFEFPKTDTVDSIAGQKIYTWDAEPRKGNEIWNQFSRYILSIEDGWLEKGDIKSVTISSDRIDLFVSLNIGDEDDLSTARKKAIDYTEKFLKRELPKIGIMLPEFKYSTLSAGAL